MFTLTYFLLFLFLFTMCTDSVRIDHTIVTEDWGGSKSTMEIPWLAVVSRVERMIENVVNGQVVADLPPDGVCGPRDNSYIMAKHISPQDPTKLALGTSANDGGQQTLVVYVYVDTSAPDCVQVIFSHSHNMIFINI